ncbi:DUF3427 domain-containing protein [Aerococcus urinaeequi]|uniref:DUF3427 domain-containing protein n=1 Tax=Aerococcus urinaeequi TaxID=51665 RepID=UPI003B3A438B
MDLLAQSLRHAFIDQRQLGHAQYDPELIINQPDENIFLLNTLQDELDTSETFTFSVAFVTESGLNALKTHLFDLHQRGIKGRLITSNYLDFNTPDIFKALLKVPNLEVRISDKEAFHAKGYLFEHKDHASFIIGSSNLTNHALKTNYEWNVKLTTYHHGAIIHQMQAHLDKEWASAQPLTEDWIEAYANSFQPPKYRDTSILLDPAKNFIVPNKMQQPALDSLIELRQNGADRGLVIAATGTGKTYLAAFDVLETKPEKVLFIVHREQILHSAMASFKRVMHAESDDLFGFYTGNKKDSQAKYIFATQQTITRDQHLHQFDPEEFDYILVDEVHRAGSASYQRIFDYFKPKFLLGLTATPERTDGYNLYELFDYNIAYEIRLQDALEADLLAPFHYFGVTDYEKDGELISETTQLKNLILDERVDYVMDKLTYYGLDKKKVKGLVFCSRNEEAKSLSDKFNDRGYNTVALSGGDSQEVRTKQVNRLKAGLLDYIFTVDIFNEGIDIPEINQVVMLRNTQSSIIFVQQMGRGLRKHVDKKFVNIIDFIGNYKNNYLIPVALSGNSNRSKDAMRKTTVNTNFLSGLSNINFESIAKERIFDSINAVKLDSMKELKEAYLGLKNELGRVPMLIDFETTNSFDPYLLANKKDNYPAFLASIKESDNTLSKAANDILKFLSREILPGKRAHELVLLSELAKESVDTLSLAKIQTILAKHDLSYDPITVQSVVRTLSTDYYSGSSKKTYQPGQVVTIVDEGITLSPGFQSAKKDSTFLHHLNDLITTATLLNDGYDKSSDLTLYQKYGRRDALRLLKWETQLVDQNIGGYTQDKARKIFTIFVTLDKGDDFTGAQVAYEDALLDPQTMTWFTKAPRTLASPEVKILQDADDWQIHMFIKKDDDEGTEFYYLGEVTPDVSTIIQLEKPSGDGETRNVVEMNLHFKETIPRNLFNYLQ